MILVVSHSDDDHAAGVLGALARDGHAALLLDTGRFPVESSLTQSFDNGRACFELSVDGRTFDLGTCRAAWWRRPLPFTLDPGMARDAASFAYTECHEAIAGLWAALDASWVNPPALDELAHHKPYQLRAAAEVGLPIPPTTITNDPEAARNFVARMRPGETIFKTFLATMEWWRETRVVRPQEQDLLDLVRLAPVIFQQYVPAVADIRVSVVGERLFATAIKAKPGGYELDYRIDMDGAIFEPSELAPETERGIKALMRRLGLVYGAIDLRRKEDGTEVFLEVNPAGEWRFVEEKTGQPITDAMADLLGKLDRNE